MKRPSLSMPCDEELLEPLGRMQWAAIRLHHGVRDLHGAIGLGISDALFEKTLGGAIAKLKELALEKQRDDIVEWCEAIGSPVSRKRNALIHAVGFTHPDGKQALRGLSAGSPNRYLKEDVLDVADALVGASRSLPAK